MSIIEFKKENLKALHFFVEHLDFPVAVATYNEWEEQQICYLERRYECFKMNTESICKWCISSEKHGKYSTTYKSIEKAIDFAEKRMKEGNNL